MQKTNRSVSHILAVLLIIIETFIRNERWIEVSGVNQDPQLLHTADLCYTDACHPCAKDHSQTKKRSTHKNTHSNTQQLRAVQRVSADSLTDTSQSSSASWSSQLSECLCLKFDPNSCWQAFSDLHCPLLVTEGTSHTSSAFCSVETAWNVKAQRSGESGKTAQPGEM